MLIDAYVGWRTVRAKRAGQYACISNLISSVSNAKALAGASAALIEPPQQVGRPDSLTAQRIQVGLVLSQMLGEQAASAYLARQAVDAKVAQRVLSGPGRRRASDDASHL